MTRRRIVASTVRAAGDIVYVEGRGTLKAKRMDNHGAYDKGRGNGNGNGKDKATESKPQSKTERVMVKAEEFCRKQHIDKKVEQAVSRKIDRFIKKAI